jgi:tRNA(Leu) C34 or U34 (ribose-2'-O)-methylase TrmL
MNHAAVALINPKYPRNVGNALRACSNFRAHTLAWTPERIDHPNSWPVGTRLPREERMRLYSDVHVSTQKRAHIIDAFPTYTPVAVEISNSAESLITFEHPDEALYVFGPEDGSLDRGILKACHRFVMIPATSCLNLAAAVNVILYDRMAKLGGDTFVMPRQTQAYAEVEG